MSHNRTKRQKDDYETRRKAAGEWFQIAVDNANAADRLAKKQSLKRQALYMMGQSMEAATKGIAIGAGVSHKGVTGWRHDFIEGFLALHDTLYKNVSIAQDAVEFFTRQSDEYGWKTGNIEEFREMLKRTVTPGSRKMKNMTEDERKNAERFYSSMLTLDSASVKQLLRIWIGMNKRMRRALKTGEDFIMERLGKEVTLKKPYPEEDPLDSIADQLIALCQEKLTLKRVTDSQRDYVKLATIEFAQSKESSLIKELENMGWKIRTEQIFGRRSEKTLTFDISLANVGLYLFGVVTWPHLAFVRYPAAPDAPTNFGEAAANPRNGKLGAMHYSDQVGVIKHISELTPKAVDITKRVRKGWEEGFVVPVEPFARSKQTI